MMEGMYLWMKKFIEKIPKDELPLWEELICKLRISKDEFIFRGHSNKDYLLIPSIGRCDNDYTYSKDIERSMFNEFKSKFHSYTNETPNKKIDVLFLAQHYGLKTRVLDWSRNIAVALYFACKEHKDVDGCLYVKKIHNSTCLKEETEDIDPFNTFNYNQIIIPDYTDVRYRNQSAVFEIFSNPEIESKADYKLLIPHSLKTDILKILNTIGFNELFMFPTLENLSMDIYERYKQSK